jgi:membrane protease YdiL (CAAX protease family)
MSRSVAIGILLSAIVFGAGHLYEGPERMIIIGVLGAILGTVSVLRKSLRPAIIAHTWQDAIAGIGQYVMRSLIT